MEGDNQRKQRFYLWDYLWWQGEMIRIHYDRPGQRIDGSMIVFLFIMALIIIPLMFGPYIFSPTQRYCLLHGLL